MSDSLWNRIQIGDWVIGVTKNEHAYRGFVEAISELQESALIRVVACDHEKMIGKVIESRVNRLVSCEFSPMQDEQDLLFLIDIALVTKDQSWFIDLTEMLRKVRMDKHHKYASATRS